MIASMALATQKATGNSGKDRAKRAHRINRRLPIKFASVTGIVGPKVRILLPPAASPERTHAALTDADLHVRWDQQMLWGGRRGRGNFVAASNRWSAAMPQPNDLSRSLVALDQNSTIIAVVELSQSSWLVAGMLPGIERQPCKKLEPSPERLLALLTNAVRSER